MGASYRSKQAHLQITCTPAEYLRHLKDLPYGRRETTVILPQYLISRCPFCKRERSAPVDTHSIHSWNNPSGSDSGQYFAHYSTVKKKLSRSTRLQALQPGTALSQPGRHGPG